MERKNNKQKRIEQSVGKPRIVKRDDKMLGHILNHDRLTKSYVEGNVGHVGKGRPRIWST